MALEKTQRLDQVAGAKYMLPNLLVNPGFEIWQRGAGPFTADNDFTADEWMLDDNSGGWQIDRVTGGLNSPYMLKITGSGVTAEGAAQQGLEIATSLADLYVTFSADVWSNTASTARLVIADYNGSTTDAAYSSYHDGDSQWARLTVTKLMRSSLTDPGDWPHAFGAIVALQCASNDSISYIDNAVAVAAEVPFPEGLSYAPLNPAEDQVRCERFYEVHGGVSTTYPAAYMYGSAGLTAAVPYGFRARKQATPTVSKVGTWGVSNCSQPSITYANSDGYCLSATVTVAGAFSFAPNSSDDTVTAEVT